MSMPFPHPTTRTLTRFADGDGATPRVHAHLARCASCRATIAFQRELRTAARALPTPDPSRATWERVLATRGAGGRTILPVDESTPRRDARGRHARRFGRVAVALLAVAGGATVWRATRVRHTEPSVAGVGAGFLANVAVAAELPRGAYPTVAPIAGIDGRRLRAGRYTFARRWTTASGAVREDGHGTIDVSATTYDGQPAWRAAHDWRYDVPGRWGERLDAETLFVARADLRPLARVEHTAPYSRYRRIAIAQRFVGDSVFGRMVAEGADASPNGRPIAQRLPTAFAPYLTDALAPLLFSTVTIGQGWRGSLSMLGWAVRPNDVFVSVALRVDGSERVTVPAGTFDCWKLTVAVGDRTFGYWVRKRDGVGVLSRDTTLRATRGVRDIVLVRE
jgi:hypothetical protein